MGSFPVPYYLPGLRAGADLSAAAKRYIALTVEADNDVNQAAANDGNFIGFLQNTPALGAAAEIASYGGGSKAIAAGTIAPGNKLKTNADGHLLAIGDNEAGSCVAIALEPAVDNDIFAVMVVPPFVSVPNGQQVLSISDTVTLAQLNAGKVLIPAVAGRSIILLDFVARVTGSFAAHTSADLQDSAATKAVVLAQAQLSNGAVLHPGETGVTLGAGFAAPLLAGSALSIVNVGSAATTGTSIAFNLTYKYV